MADKTREISENSFTTEIAISMLIHSFKHSQGDPYLQSLIFEYIHTKHPSWKIDDQDKFKNESQRVIHEFLGSHIPKRHKNISATDIDEALILERQEFISELLKDKYKNDQVPIIMEKIINRDHHFIITRGGRPRLTDNIKRDDPYTNPFTSYFCYFGVDEHSTGNKLFDDIYDKSVRLLNDRLQNDPRISLNFLNTLIPVLERHYENFATPRKAMNS